MPYRLIYVGFRERNKVSNPILPKKHVREADIAKLLFQVAASCSIVRGTATCLRDLGIVPEKQIF
jgi:hypothetical protein